MPTPSATPSFSMGQPTAGPAARAWAAVIGAAIAFGVWVLATGGFDGSASRGEVAALGLAVGLLAAWKGVDAIVKGLKPTPDRLARSWQWQSDLGNLAVGAGSATYVLALSIEAQPAIALVGLAVAIVFPLILTVLHAGRQARIAAAVEKTSGGQITDWAARPTSPINPLAISVRRTSQGKWVGEILVWGSPAGKTAPKASQADAGLAAQVELRKALAKLLR